MATGPDTEFMCSCMILKIPGGWLGKEVGLWVGGLPKRCDGTTSLYFTMIVGTS
jgi:hypothetical protein